MPAAEASLPRLLEDEQLEGGNALMMGADQLAQFVGPALAGAVIALFGASHVAGGQAGEPHRRRRRLRRRRGLVRRLGGDARCSCARCRRSAPAPAPIRSPPRRRPAGSRCPGRPSAGCSRCSRPRTSCSSGRCIVGVPVLAQTRFAAGRRRVRLADLGLRTRQPRRHDRRGHGPRGPPSRCSPAGPRASSRASGW